MPCAVQYYIYHNVNSVERISLSAINLLRKLRILRPFTGFCQLKRRAAFARCR